MATALRLLSVIQQMKRIVSAVPDCNLKTIFFRVCILFTQEQLQCL